mmetsp:Transcript_21249/g.50505  ORF Transcript_21249/g.50505 Transcript_21249/m.50505 type:complete len:231 (-) Transcript_21249:1131-1823(-)
MGRRKLRYVSGQRLGVAAHVNNLFELGGQRAAGFIETRPWWVHKQRVQPIKVQRSVRRYHFPVVIVVVVGQLAFAFRGIFGESPDSRIGEPPEGPLAFVGQHEIFRVEPGDLRVVDAIVQQIVHGQVHRCLAHLGCHHAAKIRRQHHRKAPVSAIQLAQILVDGFAVVVVIVAADGSIVRPTEHRLAHHGIRLGKGALRLHVMKLLFVVLVSEDHRYPECFPHGCLVPWL